MRIQCTLVLCLLKSSHKTIHTLHYLKLRTASIILLLLSQFIFALGYKLLITQMSSLITVVKLLSFRQSTPTPYTALPFFGISFMSTISMYMANSEMTRCFPLLEGKGVSFVREAIPSLLSWRDEYWIHKMLPWIQYCVSFTLAQ